MGLEFSSLFGQLGSEVHVFELLPVLLPGSEPEVSQYIEKYLSSAGIRIHTKTKIKIITSVSEDAGGEFKYLIEYEDPEGVSHQISSNYILIATGRKPNIERLGIKKADVDLTPSGFLKVNEYFQSSKPSIWAAGDVIGNPMLEPLAAKQGKIAVDNIYAEFKKTGNSFKSINLDLIPKVTFTTPEVASVGLTDEEANKRGHPCACNTIPLEILPKAKIMGEKDGIIKMILNRETHKILGVHIISPHASELINEAAVLLKMGATVEDLIDVVHVFPSYSELLKLAAISFFMDITKLSCCTQ